MGTSNRTNLTTRVEALESDVSEIKGGVRSILDHLQGKAVAAPATQALSAPVVAGEVVKSTKKGKRKARKTADRKPVKGGTVEGKRCLVRGNREQFIADHDWAQRGQSVAALCQAVASGAPLVGSWAIGPVNAEKFGVKQQKTTAVVARTSATEPAKVFRRANGTIAPKDEYVLRAALEAQGLSRKTVDKKVAKAQKVLASA